MVTNNQPEILLRAVLFDMDGVLCDTDEFHYQSWKQALSAYGIPFSRTTNDRLRGLTRQASLEVVLEGRDTPDDIKELILEQKNLSYLEQIRALSGTNLLPGVANLLKELSAQGILIGVASASQHVDTVLERLGISSLVRATCRGNQLARTKPAPDPYLYIAGRLGVSAPACLVVEDSRAGVQAGVAAEMCVLGLGPRERLDQAYEVYPGLNGITANKLRAIHSRWLAERERNGYVVRSPDGQSGPGKHHL